MKDVKRFVREHASSPYLLGLILLFLWEWLFCDYATLKSFRSDPFSSAFKLVFFYFISCVLAHVIRKAGSDIEFVTSTRVKSAVEDIIEGAEDRLYIVSPFVDPGSVLLESIVRAAKRDVRVFFIHNSSQLNSSTALQALSRLSNAGVEVYHHPNLHAKVYANELFAMISSLNLVTSSFSNSIEIGLIMDDLDFRNAVRQFIEDDLLKSDLCQRTELNLPSPKTGFCIRTKQVITFNASKPIQYDEFVKSGRNEQGQYCHNCGRKSETAVGSPFCMKCSELFQPKSHI
jgi:hypothetical protein